MYRVGTGAVHAAAGAAAAGDGRGNRSPGGHASASRRRSRRVNATTGSYFTNGGNASFQNRRPIEPFTKLDVTQPGLVAHGALLTGRRLERPGELQRRLQPARSRTARPCRPSSSATRRPRRGCSRSRRSALRRAGSSGSSSPRASSWPTAIPDALGIGTQRLFSSLGGVVLYAPADRDGLQAADLRARAGVRHEPLDGRLRGRRRRTARAPMPTR